jgi:hypothetical protein
MGSDGSHWTQLSLEETDPTGRPSHGAGCNVPDLQKGYYLGGIVGGDSTTDVQSTYLHSLAVFDMQKETLSRIPVPDYVPVVNQSLVFLNTATRSGALITLGGYIERNGMLSLVNHYLINELYHFIYY